MTFKLQAALRSALAAIATSQGLVTQRNLSLPMAKMIAEAALGACKDERLQHGRRRGRSGRAGDGDPAR